MTRLLLRSGAWPDALTGKGRLMTFFTARPRPHPLGQTLVRRRAALPHDGADQTAPARRRRRAPMRDMTSLLIATVASALATGSLAAVVLMTTPAYASGLSEAGPKAPAARHDPSLPRVALRPGQAGGADPLAVDARLPIPVCLCLRPPQTLN